MLTCTPHTYIANELDATDGGNPKRQSGLLNHFSCTPHDDDDYGIIVQLRITDFDDAWCVFIRCVFPCKIYTTYEPLYPAKRCLHNNKMASVADAVGANKTLLELVCVYTHRIQHYVG